MLKTIEHGQTKGPAKYKYTHSKMLNNRTTKKNNVNRETQVLKAIINQTRSIGNEFLVINIKAKQGPGQSRLCTVVQGCTRRFSPAGQNQHQQSIERTPSTTLSPSPGMEMKIDQTTTTTTSRRWKKESQQAYIFAYLFIR